MDYPDNPNYRISEPKLLYIDRRGAVYPDCKTYKTPAICSIFDASAAQVVHERLFADGEERLFNMITVETSGLCQANCFYCFQRGNRYDCQSDDFWTHLHDFLEAMDTRWLFFSGGEILVQQDSLAFIRACRKTKPGTWFHLKTNGCVSPRAASTVEELFDSIMVSFNGFSPCILQNHHGG